MTTTQLHGCAHYTLTATPEDSVRDYLGDQEDSFNVDGLVDRYRDEINAALDGTGIRLIGSDFYADYPSPHDSTSLIKDAIGSVDLADFASEYDRDCE